MNSSWCRFLDYKKNCILNACGTVVCGTAVCGTAVCGTVADSSAAVPSERCPPFLSYAANQGWLFLAIGPVAALIASLLSGGFILRTVPVGNPALNASFAVTFVKAVGLDGPLCWLGGCMAAVSKAHVLRAFKLACVCTSGSYFLRAFLARIDEEVGRHDEANTSYWWGCSLNALLLLLSLLLSPSAAGESSRVPLCPPPHLHPHPPLQVYAISNVSPEEWLLALASTLVLGFILGRCDRTGWHGVTLPYSLATIFVV